MGAVTNLPGRLLGLLEGLGLLAYGLFLAGLARSDRYWYFLNPKYAPLTLAAGVALALVGLAVTLFPGPRRASLGRLARLALLAAFLGLAVFAVSRAGFDAGAAPDRTATGKADVGLPEPEDTASRVTLNGHEYVRLNLGELFLLLDRRKAEIPARFTARGLVRRTPELDRQGLFVVERTAVTCCLADAVAAAFLVHGDSSGLRENQWVSVYGWVEPLRDKTLAKKALRTPGVSMTVVNEKFRITAEAVTPVPSPEMPYIFDFHEREPFAW